MITMNRERASRILTAYGVNDAGELLAFKETKAYKVWAFENGIVKEMGRKLFGWVPDMGAAVFALDNKMPIVAPEKHPALVEGRRIQAVWYCQSRAAAIALYKESHP